MQTFNSYTLWATFSHLNSPEITDVELARSMKVIVDRSNAIINCHGILCAMIYQQNSSLGPVVTISMVLVTMSLLIVTCNRIQYNGNSPDELKMQIQQTGPVLPTLRYIAPEVLLIVLLILEGHKAGGAAGVTIVVLLFIALLGLAWYFSMKQSLEKRFKADIPGNQVEIV